MVLENRTNGKRYESNNSLRKERGKKKWKKLRRKIKTTREGKDPYRAWSSLWASDSSTSSGSSFSVNQGDVI